VSVPVARIFLLSHMRAYTSLIGHILGSHPEIDGYYEMHLSYASADDLARQACAYATHAAFKPGSRYLFDKLLHNDHAFAPEGLGDAELSVLLTLRPPEPTLASIIGLFARKPADDPYATPAGAAAYYVARLAALVDFARRHPGGYLYFDAPLVRTDTPRLLAALGTRLGLATPLAETYRIFAKTGVVGAGDSSPAIAAGRVLRTPTVYPEHALDAATLAQVERAYVDARETLIAHAADALTS
jgi:hypothetical protein